MKKRQVWFRDFDGWFYGQVGKGRRRRQKRILRGPNTPTRFRKAQRKYNNLLKADPGLLSELSATDSIKSVFISFLKLYSKRHCSPETHRWYRCFLKSFARKYGSIRFCDLTPEDVEAWLDEPKITKRVCKKTEKVFKRRCVWSETTRNRAITCVKVAVNWFIRRKKLKDNPLADLKKPAMGRRERIVAPEERELIFSSVKDEAFRLFLKAVAGTGARPGELRKVEAKHFHLSGLWVFPPKQHKTGKKTGKPRVIYLTPEMTELCKKLAAEQPEGPLFLNTRGKPWTVNAIRIRFRNRRKRFPQLKGVVCYCYRHTFTTDGLLNGVPVAQMQELLGHTSPAMMPSHRLRDRQRGAAQSRRDRADRRLRVPGVTLQRGADLCPCAALRRDREGQGPAPQTGRGRHRHPGTCRRGGTDRPWRFWSSPSRSCWRSLAMSRRASRSTSRTSAKKATNAMRNCTPPRTRQPSSASPPASAISTSCSPGSSPAAS